MFFKPSRTSGALRFEIWFAGRYTQNNFSSTMARNAALTIVEAENIVPIGSISPNAIHLPGIYVDRIVRATAPKQIEFATLARADAHVEKSKDVLSPQKADALEADEGEEEDKAEEIKVQEEQKDVEMEDGDEVEEEKAKKPKRKKQKASKSSA